MDFIATMTLKQLSALRIMLRLQKVKSIRRALQKFKAGTTSEALALEYVLHNGDLITAVDIPLMRIESRTVESQGDSLDPHAPVNVELDETHLQLCKSTADAVYGAEGDFGSQAEQGAILQIVREEAEGLRLALATATSKFVAGGLPVFQQIPKGRQ